MIDATGYSAIDLLRINQQNENIRWQTHADNQRAYLMTNAYVPPEVMRLRRAQKVAAEVRARHPEMQVKRVMP